MTTLEHPARPAPTGRSRGSGKGGAALAFAVVALPLLLWQVSTLVRWVSRGHVEQITQYRDTEAASWVVAHVFEAIFFTLFLGLIGFAVRGCIRERRFTLDAMILLGLFLSAWLDPAFMFYKQIFFYSSQFLNVRAWCGDMPGVLNPECGMTAEPLIVPVLYADVLAIALLAGAVIRVLRRRTTTWSLGRTLLVAGLVGAAFDMAMEIPVIYLDLWKYASGPDILAPPGLRGGTRYSLTTAFTFGLITASVTALRQHLDDRGQSLLERGTRGKRLGRLRTMLAVVAFTQLTVIASFVPAMVAAPYSGPWHTYPAHLTNGMCDNNVGPGTPTPYPCS
jgi:hypothetical protein